jgi:predicted transposase YdaD
VISSAAEAEIGSVFLNAKEATLLRTSLEEMGYPQPPTPLQTDSTTTMGYNNDTIKQRCTRAMDMCFYWGKYRVKQGQFHVYCGPGYHNLAD